MKDWIPLYRPTMGDYKCCLCGVHVSHYYRREHVKDHTFSQQRQVVEVTDRQKHVNFFIRRTAA